jgi:hypothetical protein
MGWVFVHIQSSGCSLIVCSVVLHGIDGKARNAFRREDLPLSPPSPGRGIGGDYAEGRQSAAYAGPRQGEAGGGRYVP